MRLRQGLHLNLESLQDIVKCDRDRLHLSLRRHLHDLLVFGAVDRLQGAEQLTQPEQKLLPTGAVLLRVGGALELKLLQHHGILDRKQSELEERPQHVASELVQGMQLLRGVGVVLHRPLALAREEEDGVHDGRQTEAGERGVEGEVLEGEDLALVVAQKVGLAEVGDAGVPDCRKPGLDIGDRGIHVEVDGGGGLLADALVGVLNLLVLGLLELLLVLLIPLLFLFLQLLVHDVLDPELGRGQILDCLGIPLGKIGLDDVSTT